MIKEHHQAHYSLKQSVRSIVCYMLLQKDHCYTPSKFSSSHLLTHIIPQYEKDGHRLCTYKL